MGAGADLSLINTTPYAWHNVYQHNYQMNTWKFPGVVNPGELAQVYIEQGSGNQVDDAGEVNYTVADASTSSFQIRFRVDGNTDKPNFSVYLETLSTSMNMEHDILNLGWVHNAATPWILIGSEGNFEANLLPTDWMHQNLDYIGCLSLREICIPGSHDAGMSKFNAHTSGADKGDTLTQNLGIADQLSMGSRWFDIRPVISGGAFYTGHYSKVLGIWQGADGQSINEVTGQINAFLEHNQELVILDVSHAYDTDNEYVNFSPGQWTQLFQSLSSIKHLWVADKTYADLSTLPLRNFIGDGPAVIVIVEESGVNSGGDGTVNLGVFANRGFFHQSQLQVYNSYTDTMFSGKMIPDQITKLKRQRTRPDSGMFLLSWTLSLTTDVAIIIIDLAQGVFPDLFTNSLWDALSKNTYPNIIMIDAWPNDQRLTALCVAINRYFTRGCSA